MPHADVVIAGAGLIGASLALELAKRGLHVALLSEGEPLAHASAAAAGMLAVDDPENPAALRPLAAHSRALYPELLHRLAEIVRSREPVRLQTHETLQAIAAASTLQPRAIPDVDLPALAPGLVSGDQTFALLPEASVDPRELAAAVRLALQHSPRIRLETQTSVREVTEEQASVTAHTARAPISGAHFVDCTGAWSLSSSRETIVHVHPRKGQMLSVRLPPDLSLTRVIRTPVVYIVPRLHGPRAGQAVIGATVEDRGFDTTVEPQAIASLHARAAALFPALASAPVVETWAGLRPAAPDLLPVLGRTGERTSIAKGHFRNGILLAPATADVLADLITGQQPAINLAPFSPDRGQRSITSAASASKQAAEGDARDPQLV